MGSTSGFAAKNGAAGDPEFIDTGHRSENVAFDAFSCATVPISSEGGPAKWLKNKNLENHLCDFEPGGRRFESVRAHEKFFIRSIS
jgi:hypothetical protein